MPPVNAKPESSAELGSTAVRGDNAARRPSWHEAAIWMGADTFALTRILSQGGFRIHPRFLGDLLIDLGFSLANTGLSALQYLCYERAVSRVELAEDPVFIIGHWRTGTTLLHELLALDERLRFPNTYECFVPGHFVLTERWLKSWSGFVLPPSRPFDNMAMAWDLPQEDEFALLNLGIPSPYAAIAFPNLPLLDGDYLTLEHLSPAQLRRWQRALQRFVRQLTYLHPGRVVLKSPTHTGRIPALLEIFPRARFINMVRNPYQVFPSTLRLWKNLFSAHGYQRPNFAGLEERVLETFLTLHERLEATRGLVAAERICDLRYEDLVNHPLEQLRMLYDRLELGNFAPAEASISKYLQQHSTYQPNRHELAAETSEAIGRRWGAYFERYGYELC